MRTPRIRSSLTTKILVAVVVSVLITALGSFLFSNLAARSAFGSYVTRSAGMRRQYLVAALEDYHATNGGWQGVGAVLDAALRMGGGHGPGMMARSGQPGMGMRMAEFDRVTLLNPSGQVIADTAGAAPGTQLKFENWEVTALRAANTNIGLLLMGALEERQASGSLYADFIRAITAGTLYSVAGAAAFALALSYYVTERAVRPIRELTEAVSSVAQGNLKARVKVTGDDEPARLARAFNSMSGQLEALERQRRDLVADVAHELRTPLTVLKSNLEGLKDGVIEGTPDLMKMLDNEVDRLSRLVADLHVLSLFDAGRFELHTGEVDCERLLLHAREAFGAVAWAKNIDLQVIAQSGLLARGDWTRLLQVTANLVENAVRHTPEGGRITLEARAADGASGRTIRLTVADTGEGIHPEDLPHLFDRFYRGDRSRSRKTGGSGLGLAIASNIVKAHGGEISVESEMGKGTRFIISLHPGR